METETDLCVDNEVDITCVSDDSMKIEADVNTDNEETGNENDENIESENHGEHFVVSTNEEMRAIIEEYCERTKSHFVVQKKSKNFGLAALECDLLGHQVQWMDMQKKNSTTADSIVQFDGIPHICVGNFYLNCQFGVDSSISKKMRRKRMREEGELDNIKLRHPKTPSKKCGCPATIVVRQIIKFPEFKIDKDTEWRRRDGAGKLKAKIKECRESLITEVIIIGRLPDVSEHKYHEILQGHEFSKEVIHRDIILKAQEMYLENKTHNEIRESLHQYVISEKFSKGDDIDFNRRRFFPTIKDIHNIVGRFRPLCKFTLEEEDTVKSLIDKIKQYDDKFNIVFEISENSINYDSEKVESSSDESIESISEKEAKERKRRDKVVQTFLFTYQTPKQQRLMRKYCNVTYLVEIELASPVRRTLIYRMYTLIVQTNVDFQVIGCIVLSKQRKDGLMEGLKLFREWNPSWNPKYFLVDCSQTIYDAVLLVFPDSNYLLNPHSCESKWMDFIVSPSNGLYENSEELLTFLKNMQYALTEDALNVAAAFLEASEIWQSNEKLRTWFLTSWLPVAKMWVYGYRPEDLLITQHLKSTLADCIHVYKEALTLSAKPSGLVQMLENITHVVSSDEYQKYVKYNNDHYVFFQNYLKNNHYSEFMHGVPISLIPYTEGICKLVETNNFSITCDNLGVFSVQADIIECKIDANEGDIKTNRYSHVEIAETEFGSIEYPNKLDPGEYTVSFGDSNSHPFCTCSQWLFYRIPCVHMFAIICKVPGWKYDMLSPLYRFSPVFDIDCSCIHHPINSNLKEEGSQVDVTYKCVETQTENDEDDIFEFPFKNGSLNVLTEQIKKASKALFHLKNISHLFKNKSFYATIHKQLKKFIHELEKETIHAQEEVSVVEEVWIPNNTDKFVTDKNDMKFTSSLITVGTRSGQITKAPIINLVKRNNLEFLHQAIKKVEANSMTNTSEKSQSLDISKTPINSLKIPAKNIALQSGICENPVLSKIIPSPLISKKRKFTSEQITELKICAPNCNNIEKNSETVVVTRSSPICKEVMLTRKESLQEQGVSGAKGKDLQNSELSVLSILPRMNQKEMSVLNILPCMAKAHQPNVYIYKGNMEENNDNVEGVSMPEKKNVDNSLVAKSVIHLVKNNPVIPLVKNTIIPTVFVNKGKTLVQNKASNLTVHNEGDNKPEIALVKNNVKTVKPPEIKYIISSAENETEMSVVDNHSHEKNVILNVKLEGMETLSECLEHESKVIDFSVKNKPIGNNIDISVNENVSNKENNED